MLSNISNHYEELILVQKLMDGVSMIIIVIVIQKEVAGSASGGCTYGTATGKLLEES